MPLFQRQDRNKLLGNRKGCRSLSRACVTACIILIALAGCGREARAYEPLPEMEIRALCEAASGWNGMDPCILQAIAFKESRYCPDAKNGPYIGLMQINQNLFKERAESLGIDDMWVPYNNILIASDYLSELMEDYPTEKAIVVYARGEAGSNGINSTAYSRSVIALANEIRLRRDLEEPPKQDTANSMKEGPVFDGFNLEDMANEEPEETNQAS